MTTTEELKTRLTQLKAVKFFEPTALQLHTQRPLLARVDRQEIKRYKEAIQKDLAIVERYLELLKTQPLIAETVTLGAMPVKKKTRYYTRGLRG